MFVVLVVDKFRNIAKFSILHYALWIGILEVKAFCCSVSHQLKHGGDMVTMAPVGTMYCCIYTEIL